MFTTTLLHDGNDMCSTQFTCQLVRVAYNTQDWSDMFPSPWCSGLDSYGYHGNVEMEFSSVSHLLKINKHLKERVKFNIWMASGNKLSSCVAEV